MVVAAIALIVCVGVGLAQGYDGKPLMVLEFYDNEWYQFDFDYDHPLSDWQSVGELRAFLQMDDTDHRVYLVADSSGLVQFNNQCEDYAFNLRKRAQIVGHNLDTEILSKAECIKWQQYIQGDAYSLGINDGHYINKAIVGNAVWYCEPQNDKVWWVYNLD